jgi:uncharacterized membrane protein YheB (UPF0754 family)
MSWAAILEDVQRNWLLYASMPVVAAIIGYVTKLLAIRMMFQPIEFVGLKPPYLGWQGIVPRNAERMATIACDTMTRRLLTPRDVFGRLDPHRVAREIEKPMLAAVEDITREVAAQYQPGLWERLPERVRNALVNRIKAESPAIVTRIMRDIQKNIETVFDLKDMVVRSLMRDKALLNRIFQEVGHKEFRFIARSGIPFGFAIGCVQAVTWAFTHSAWVMPLFGGFTGWFTDWLALKMIFRPRQPTRYFGLFEWQGLFLKRRKEVAAEYGALIAKEVITPRNVLEAVLRGPLSDKLYELVVKHVRASIDEQAGIARPLVEFAVGKPRYEQMKQAVAQKMMERLPETMKHIEDYAADAMDLKNTLVTKMQELNEEEFEALLRPAFQQDEWILIACGAALGFLVGELQVFVMLHVGH